MIFSSLEFVIFFAAVLLGVAVLKTNRQRKALLLLASWYFYAYWDWRFLGLLLLSTVTDYCVGLGLGSVRSVSGRRALLGISLATNLGLLGVFKYYDFFVESLAPLLSGMGLHVGTLHLLLPVGISFYTFQTLSYTLDVYRGHMAPHRSLLDFSLFVGFFPQLVAGPIVRASHFIPQLDKEIVLTGENARQGFRLFVFGLTKKVFLADRIAMFVDPVFANAAAFGTTTLWLASFGYTLQIYYDFSGYSDMAIGLARILGFDLGRNFDFPYLSRGPSEFWRRWHISLSSWVRDYLYIPMGGNRKGTVRTDVHLLASMLIMGLWHGAAWTFVAWGGLHGILLVLEKRVRASGVHRRWQERHPAVATMLQWAVCLLAVNAGWVLFRAQSFELAWEMLARMFLPTGGVVWISPFVLFALVVTTLVHALQACGRSSWIFLSWKWYTPGLLFALLWASIIFAPTGFAPFIYFQF